MAIKYKKRIRLEEFVYKGCYRYFITICAHDKKPLFVNSDLISWLIDILKEKSTSFDFIVWAYCFMPDHLHFLIEGKSSDSNMKKFIAAYKQNTGYYYKKKSGSSLWQINYYEHVLRKEENLLTIARYIFDNPARKGLVDDFVKYKYLGSFEFDVNQM